MILEMEREQRVQSPVGEREQHVQGTGAAQGARGRECEMMTIADTIGRLFCARCRLRALHM